MGNSRSVSVGDTARQTLKKICRIVIRHVCWYHEGMKRKRPQKKQKKITAILPADLLEAALEASGEGIAATLKEGLKFVAASQAYKKLRTLRGKVKVSIDLESLRADK